MAAFLAAAKAGDVDELRRQLREDAALLAYCGAGTPDSVSGNSALHWASANGHEPAVALLLEARADPSARNNGDSTPLHSAALKNRASCARALVRASADPLLADEYGDSPLKLAERAQNLEVVAAMREASLGASPQAAPPSRSASDTSSGVRVGATAPSRRSADEHKESGNACFKAGQYDGAYAHYSAAMALLPAEDEGSGQAGAVEQRAALLSNRSGALAALERWDEAEADARAALERRPDWFKAHARLGAALEGRADLEGAVAAYEVAARLDGAGEVTSAALKRARAALRAARLEALLERNANANGAAAPERPPRAAAAHEPRTAKTPEQVAYATRVAAWQGAAKRGDVRALTELLAANAELLHNRSEDTAERLLGNTALHWAAAYGRVDAARWLLARRADPNGRNHGGSSPLHSACSHAQGEVVTLLLDDGADPACNDENGEDAHMAAARRGHMTAAGLLDRGTCVPAVRWSLRAKPLSAAEAKAAGNAAFARGGGAHRLAISHYTDALVLLADEAPGDGGADFGASAADAAAMLHSNRSGAHASLAHAVLALDDARRAVALRPDWAKGWSRVGAALHLARDWEGATEAYAHGLRLEPESAALRHALAEAEKQRARQLEAEAESGG